ncbi:MAG: adenylate/guanylate cyclase domain-containing protein, partial [Actinomycetota bacterium]|nr:adenylate/guanylate cyclase domain-containing protein [Actinomycetota bacterium]
MDLPETAYAPTPDGGYIAYKAIGNGPIEVAHLGAAATQVEVMWEYEPCSRFWLDLASSVQLIVHDRRGTGLSDAGAGLPDLETRASDLLAVLDHAKVERPHLFGTSDGGMVCAFFAAAHPERAASFFWPFAAAKGTRAPDWPFSETGEWLERFSATVIATGWGTDAGIREQYGAQVEGRTDGLVPWLAKMQRAFCGPATAADFFRLWGEYDVRDVLPALRVRTRTLELEPVPYPEDVGLAEATAALIPDAEHRTITAPTSFLWDNAEDWLASIREFIGAQKPPAEIDRVLATVLFTDIVGSTQRVARSGDAQWKDVLAAHNERARREIERHRGRYVESTGDGLLATFDGPARAVRCAEAIRDAVRDLGFEIRAGCHTGEIELAGDAVRGIAVHIGARVAALAGSSEVLVSSTVKDLVAGSGLTFEDAGEHELKG